MSEDKIEEIAEDVKSDNLTETDEPEVNNHPSIKLSGLMGTKLGMTHSLMDVLVVEVLLELSGEKEDSILLVVLEMFNKYSGGKF